jgi:hypothetical protein
MVKFMAKDDDGDEGIKFEECGAVQMPVSELRKLPKDATLHLLKDGTEAGTLNIKWA